MSAEQAQRQAVEQPSNHQGRRHPAQGHQEEIAAARSFAGRLAALDHQGYVIVRHAVPAANVERLVDLLWGFDEKDPDDPSTWYAPQRRDHKMKELNNTGMLEIYNHQYLWDNRQEQRVYDAFVDIWDREDLWVTIDRANLNPPKKVKGNPNGFIHWDVDTSHQAAADRRAGRAQPQEAGRRRRRLPMRSRAVQQFRRLGEDPASRPRPDAPRHDQASAIVNVEMEAGDLLIFNRLLAHGVRPNHSDGRVRMAQYISMYPAEQDNEAERQERIRLWRELDHPQRDAFPGDPRDWEKKHAETAKLTPLGERLLGLKPWH